MNDWAREDGAAGLGYINFIENNFKGPIAKNLNEKQLLTFQLKEEESIFFISDELKNAQLFAGKARIKLCSEYIESIVAREGFLILIVVS